MAHVIRIQHTSIPMPPGEGDKARMFYGDVLGMEERRPPETLNNELVWFRAGPDGQEVHIFADANTAHNSSEQHLCLQVEDLAELKARLEDAGVSIQETESIRNRPRFFVRDPFDNLIELTQITGEYDE